MDRRRRGELFVPVFAPALRTLSDRRLDRQRPARGYLQSNSIDRWSRGRRLFSRIASPAFPPPARFLLVEIDRSLPMAVSELILGLRRLC